MCLTEKKALSVENARVEKETDQFFRREGVQRITTRRWGGREKRKRGLSHVLSSPLGSRKGGTTFIGPTHAREKKEGEARSISKSPFEPSCRPEDEEGGKKSRGSSPPCRSRRSGWKKKKRGEGREAGQERSPRVPLYHQQREGGGGKAPCPLCSFLKGGEKAPMRRHAEEGKCDPV